MTGTTTGALRARRARTALTATAVLALVCCAWFGHSWFSTARSEYAGRASAREAALDAGTAALDTLHTVDHTRAGRSVDTWIDVTTGDLAERFRKGRGDEIADVERSGTTAEASVAGAALSHLDVDAGTARMLAVVEIDLESGSDGPRARRNVLVAELSRTGDGWKVASVQEAR